MIPVSGLDYLLESPTTVRLRSGLDTTRSRPPRDGNSTKQSILRNLRTSPKNWSYASIERHDLAMDCGDMGRYANAKNILSQHPRFLLDKDEAEKIISDMKARVEATWYGALRANGVFERDTEAVRGSFA
jgi:hypothetical protein